MFVFIDQVAIVLVISGEINSSKQQTFNTKKYMNACIAVSRPNMHVKQYDGTNKMQANATGTALHASAAYANPMLLSDCARHMAAHYA